MKVKWSNSDRQMSEAFITCVFLALSGGFQDAYTYFVRDGVFSNAQTGNVVLMSQSFFTGDWGRGLRYLFPLLAFIAGVFVAEKVQGRFKYAKRIHWRQGILIGEILILLVVSFIPESLNTVATALVSFSCAMQVQAFRKVNGYSYASTMCIGNIRSGTAALSAYHRETQIGAVEAGVILYRDYPLLCHRRRNRRQSVHAVWNPGNSESLLGCCWLAFC